ncbi:MAG: hypothetical protein AB1640_00480 [bacterium]
MAKRDEKKRSAGGFLSSKKGIALLSVPVLIAAGVVGHEAAVQYFPEVACVACHEMNEPVKRWKDSGVAKNHQDCADCHFDTGIARVWDMNRDAVVLFVKHFTRDKEEPIQPPEPPIFVDPAQEPAYYSLVPNHRCFQCKDAKNHNVMDQAAVHTKLVSFAGAQPCKDCHNHDMRNGMKFYEKILQDPNAPASGQETPAAGASLENLARN